MLGKRQEGLVACREEPRNVWSHVGKKPGRVGCMSGDAGALSEYEVIN